MPGGRWFWGWALLSVVLLCAGAVRLGQALRVDVVGDEMLHLPSFRNHYESEDIFPIFRRRLDAPGSVPESVRPLLRAYYDRGALAQRSLLILIDGHPPLHPLVLELVQAATKDGLAVMRGLSLLASLAGVVLAFRLGRELLDFTLGLWLAALLAVSLVPAFFGGVGRSYAFVEPAAAWFYLCALRACRRGVYIDRRVLWAALLWQFVQWFSWPLVGASLGALVVLRWRSGRAAPSLLRQTAWYAVLSLLLLAYLYVQSRNPTLRRAGSLELNPMRAAELFVDLAPTNWLELVSPSGAWLGALSTLGVLAVGAWRCRTVVADPAVRGVCIWLPLSVGALLLLAAPGHVRHVAAVGVPVALLASLGLRVLLPTSFSAAAALTWTIAGAATQLAVSPPHHSMLEDPRPGFVATAPVLEAEIRASGRWVSYPYFVADSYYRALRDVPAPEQPQSLEEFMGLLEGSEPLTVLMYRETALPSELRGRLESVARVDSLASIYRLAPRK